MKLITLSKSVSVLFSLVVAANASATPLPPGPVAGDIYVSESPLLVKIGADGTQTAIPTTILTPSGIVFDQAGNVYIGDAATNSVVKITPDGTQTTVVTGLSDPKDLALDSSGNLYVANSGTNSVIKIAPNGTKTTVATGLNGPAGLAFDTAGNLFVSSANGNKVFEISADGVKSTFVSAGLNSPGGLAFDANGNLLVADTGSDSILKIDRDGNVTTAVGTGLNNPADVAVDALGDLLVANTGNNSITKISPNGVEAQVAAGLSGIRYLAMAPGLHQLLDVSTRGFVGTGDHVLIGGFIVRGTPEADLGQTTVLLRAIGPSLQSAGVTDPLANPVLELHDSTGALVATNNNWRDTQQAAIQTTGLAPKNNLESAIKATLPDGTYTAIVSGLNNSTGVALVEVYKLQDNP